MLDKWVGRGAWDRWTRRLSAPASSMVGLQTITMAGAVAARLPRARCLHPDCRSSPAVYLSPATIQSKPVLRIRCQASVNSVKIPTGVRAAGLSASVSGAASTAARATIANAASSPTRIPLLGFMQTTTFEPLAYDKAVLWHSPCEEWQDPVPPPVVTHDSNLLQERDQWLKTLPPGLVVHARARYEFCSPATSIAGIQVRMRETLWVAVEDALAALAHIPGFTANLKMVSTEGKGILGVPEECLCTVQQDDTISHVLLPTLCQHRFALSPGHGNSHPLCVQQMASFMLKNDWSVGVVLDDTNLYVLRMKEGKLLISDEIKLAEEGALTIVIYAIHLALQHKSQCQAQGVPCGPGLPYSSAVQDQPATRRMILNIVALTPATSLGFQPFTMAQAHQTHRSEPVRELVINGFLGEGDTGKVYETTYQGNRVALKLADSELAMKGQHGLITELQAYAKLQGVWGAAVADILAAGIVQGLGGSRYPFVAMRKVGDGLSLHEAAAQLQPADLACIAKQAMSSLHLIHSCGVAHGDLGTPGNILLETYRQVKLIDFSHAVVNPTADDYAGDVADLEGMLVDAAAECLQTGRDEAQQAVKGWLSG